MYQMNSQGNLGSKIEMCLNRVSGGVLGGCIGGVEIATEEEAAARVIFRVNVMRLSRRENCLEWFCPIVFLPSIPLHWGFRNFLRALVGYGGSELNCAGRESRGLLAVDRSTPVLLMINLFKIYTRYVERLSRGKGSVRRVVKLSEPQVLNDPFVILIDLCHDREHPKDRHGSVKTTFGSSRRTCKHCRLTVHNHCCLVFSNCGKVDYAGEPFSCYESKLLSPFFQLK
ncbi:hypothetical protein Nepgr_023287 [Nepenthes gracilis]|uniref:Uncharacterized protein n=1 Tax=Nepenthes gracilis TaxID=150966 RepID=A0AAD3T252_NEPGR|nr:hypothetical protein Nepgr_023287 [Nepenthes gracilis]